MFAFGRNSAAAGVDSSTANYSEVFSELLEVYKYGPALSKSSDIVAFLWHDFPRSPIILPEPILMKRAIYCLYIVSSSPAPRISTLGNLHIVYGRSFASKLQNDNYTE